MKDIYTSFGKVLVRVPIHSISDINNINRSKPSFQEGLYLASKELYNQYIKYNQLDKKSQRKLNLAITKYWKRSCTRCVPYANFAGVLLAELSEKETKLIIKSDLHERVVKVDMNCFQLIVDEITSNINIREQLYYTNNNSLQETLIDYRYVEFEYKNKIREYNLTSFDKASYIKVLLAYTKEYISYRDLVTKLSEIANVTPNQSSEFIDELIRSQILVSEIEPNITGKDPLFRLIDNLRDKNNSSNICNKLETLNKRLKNSTPEIANYENLISIIDELLANKKDIKDKIQVDLFIKAKEFNISKPLINTIISQLNDLCVISRPYENKKLNDFKDRFRKRYNDREVALLDVLDADLGIGYGDAVSDKTEGDTQILDINKYEYSTNSKSDTINHFVLEKYSEILFTKNKHIEITQNDLSIYFNKTNVTNELPNSMYILGCLIKNGDSDFNFQVKTFSGPSAINLLGRFTNNGNDIEEFSTSIAQEEEKINADCIYAEIVHLPESRIGNILQRSTLRKYEIPYLGCSGLDKEHQILPSDIFVSIINNEIILKSKRHNKRIIPRLSTAHNYKHRSLPVYKFLCDLQMQNIFLPTLWDWGELSYLKFLPRVIYKNIIIRKARWRIRKTDIINATPNNKDYTTGIERVCEKYKLPNDIILLEGDNELQLSLNRKDDVDILWKAINKNQLVTLEEVLFTNDNCIIQDEDGNPYTNEIIIPVRRCNPVKLKNSVWNFNDNNTYNRINVFEPCSQWVYYNIYSGVRFLDKFLVNELYHFVINGLKQSKFEKFFFIRYKDDNPHLRVRFYNSSSEKQVELMRSFNKLAQPYVKAGLIHDFGISTYVREANRYNPNLIQEAETLFYFDSISTLKFLKTNNDSSSDDNRIQYTLISIDSLLNDFGFTLDEKVSLLELLSRNFIDEFGGEKLMKRNLDKKYRDYEKNVTRVLGNNDIKYGYLDSVIKILNERSKKIKPAVGNILTNTNLNSDLYYLLQSYIHMIVNRVFITHPRKYELIIYYFLYKYYSSVLARKKYNS